jgi:imidazolonepropionase-like amidohydrolase
MKATTFALLSLTWVLAAQDATLFRDVTLFDGEAFTFNRSVLVRDGKVVTIGDASLQAAGAKTYAVDGGFLIPGLVLADAVRAGATERSVFPGLFAPDAHDAFAPQALLDAGITTLWASPGRNRFVPGSGGVVSLAPADFGGGVAAQRPVVHVVLSPAAFNPPQVYVPAVPPGPDDRPAIKRQLPRTRAGAAMAFRELLALAREPESETVRALDEDDRDAVAIFAEVLSGKRGLRFRADRVEEVALAIELAKEAGQAPLIEGGAEAWKLAKELAAAGAAVILEQPSLSAAKPRLDELDVAADAAGLLSAAGVRLAIAPVNAEAELLWIASRQEHAAFGRERVLRAITLGAAELLGCEQGRVREGAIADLLLFDRDPLAAGTRPIVVMAHGRVVRDRFEKADAPVAVRAGRVLPGDGTVIVDGTVLIVNGKVAGVGRGITIPPGARIIDVPEGVVVPGFINAGTQTGVRNVREAEGEVVTDASLGALGLEQSPAQFFDAEQDDVAAAAASGVTTAVLLPGGGRNVSGPLALVKCGSASDDALSVKVAGVFCDFTGRRHSESEVDGLRKILEGAKKYFEGFEKWKKDVAAFDEKNPPKPVEVAHAVTRSTAPPERARLGDLWRGEMWSGRDVLADGHLRCIVRFSADKEAYKVKVETAGRDPFEGTAHFEGDELIAEGQIAGKKLIARGLLQRDEWAGQATLDGKVAATFLLKRQREVPAAVAEKVTSAASDAAASKNGSAKPAEAPKQDEAKGRPKPPARNEALESWKAVLEGEAPIYLAADNERLARALLRMLRNEFDVRVAFMEGRLLPEMLPLIKELGVAFVSNAAPLLRREGRDWSPILEAARAGVPVMLLHADSARLVDAASLAVQQGLNSDDALRMLTRWPALVLNQQQKLGAIAMGRDGDLVILSGEPFAPATRILHVVSKGRMVAMKEKE